MLLIKLSTPSVMLFIKRVFRLLIVVPLQVGSAFNGRHKFGFLLCGVSPREILEIALITGVN